MALLRQEAPEKITDLEEHIVIRHLYIERRMAPLNIWLEQEGQQLRDAIEEYGKCIHAMPLIFSPAICCLKTFGVTRHGRVVFYDFHDEICYMTEVNFMRYSASALSEDELTSEPRIASRRAMFSREEFRHRLRADPLSDHCLKRAYADLFRQITGARATDAY